MNTLKREQPYWLYALLYATVYVFLIPWTEIRGAEFVDIENYIFRINYLHHGGKEHVYHGIAWLFSEPLWVAILHGIGNVFTDIRLVLYGISFFIVTVFSHFLFKRLPIFVVIIFLINPLSVHLFIEQIRSGLGLALLLLAYDSSSKKIAIFLILMAVFIHAAMYIFVTIYFLLYLFDHIVEPKKYYLWIIIFAFLFALFMGYGLHSILQAIGDRHAASVEDPGRVTSVKYTVGWFVFAGIFTLWADFTKRHIRIIVGYAIFMMSFVFFLSLIGSTSTRFVAAVIPFILLSISYLPKHFKEGTYMLLFAYDVLLFQYWFRAWIL